MWQQQRTNSVIIVIITLLNLMHLTGISDDVKIRTREHVGDAVGINI